MSPEDEAAKLKLENAELLKERAAAAALWHEEVRSSLKAITLKIATIELNTNDLQQLRANQASQAERIRTLEDRWIIIIATLVMTVVGCVLYVNWKLL